MLTLGSQAYRYVSIFMAKIARNDRNPFDYNDLVNSIFTWLPNNVQNYFSLIGDVSFVTLIILTNINIQKLVTYCYVVIVFMLNVSNHSYLKWLKSKTIWRAEPWLLIIKSRSEMEYANKMSYQFLYYEWFFENDKMLNNITIRHTDPFVYCLYFNNIQAMYDMHVMAVDVFFPDVRHHANDQQGRTREELPVIA